MMDEKTKNANRVLMDVHDILTDIPVSLTGEWFEDYDGDDLTMEDIFTITDWFIVTEDTADPGEELGVYLYVSDEFGNEFNEHSKFFYFLDL